MLNVSEQLKNILKNDRFPMTDTVASKDLEIIFDGTSPIYADQVVDDSFSLTESIIAEDDIRFGTCRASQIKFKLANVQEELKSKEFTINQLIDNEYVIPLGKYKVESAKLQDDLIFKEVIAYDKLKDADVDVSDWYNGLFPAGNETYTLKQFRSSLLAHLGIEEVDQTLPNDNMVIPKTIEPTQISGRAVLEATVELNGAFGHINREGNFVRKVLKPAYGDYPTNDYPTNDYPISENDTSYVMPGTTDDTISKAMYQSVRFEEYEVKEIDKLQIRSEEHDIGAIVGTGSNTYVIEGNFLVYGKSAAELEQIAINAFGNMAKRPYRPYTAQSIGLPYVEVGDTLEFATDDTVVGYVLQRTLTGIQALRDEYEAPGSEEREQNFGVNKELIQTQGKLTRIKKDVEGVRVEVEDLADSTSTRFEQTATSIAAEVSRATGAESTLNGKITLAADAIAAEVSRATAAEGTLSGSISVLAGQVVLKVDANGNIAVVELDADPSEGTSIKLKADNIELEGYISINGYTKILPNGSLEVTNAKISGQLMAATGTFSGNLSAVGGTFTGTLSGANGTFTGTLSGGAITGSTFDRTVGGIVWTKIDDYGLYQYVGGGLTFQVGYYYQNGYIYSDGSGIQMGASGSALSINQYGVYINGSTPITSANIGSQDVYSLRGAVYVSANANFRPFSSGGSSCGTADGKWSSVWAVNGTIQTSDEREKTDILLLEEDERFLRFAKMIAPYTFKMVMGTSGRKHIGFIAQRIEEAMNECGISDMEFAGLIKAPVYAEKLKDEEGSELDEFDTSSEIIDYSYHLRYEEFIPLIFLWLRSLELD